MISKTLTLAIICSVAFIPFSFADEPKIPTDAQPLNGSEIKQLLDGKKFSFTAYDEPLTGTTLWESNKGKVSGDYVYKKTTKGTYEVKWFIKDNKSCTQSQDNDAVCQNIYRYEKGFMEVTSKGVLHAVSAPSN